MKHNYKKRIQRVISSLKALSEGEGNALIVSSNPAVTRSADQHYPYRANSDLYYLTGSTAEDLTVVIRDKALPHVVLVTPQEDPKRTLWEGKPPSLLKLAKEIGASVIRSKSQLATVNELIKGARCVFTQSISGTISNAVRQDFAKLLGETPRNSPLLLGNADTLTSPLRLIKSNSEVTAIERAGYVTSQALHSVLPLLIPGTKERDIAQIIDCVYKTNGGAPAFATIVASGASAATLHYHALNKSIKSGDFVLIDTGVELDMYCSDVTRTIPVGKISQAQRTLYEAVLSSQNAAFRSVKHGALIGDIYLAAAREITLGLKDVGILKGSISALMKKRAFKPYFPHGIGHSLGIDVHDVGGLRGDQGAHLSAGMIFTIEPGIYLAKPTKHLPALGIRIEDDILVERNGCSVLTEHVFPKDLAELTTE